MPSEEELKNMSPEELMEYQKKNCLFCHIIEGKVASKKIYEDEYCIGILDINPANPGHVIVLPKEHFSIIPMMPEERFRKIIISSKMISVAMLRVMKAEGVNMFIANGQVAGQKSPHALIHLIPRKEGDGISAFDLPKNEIEPADQKKLFMMIKKNVNEMLGIVEEIEEETEEKKIEQVPAGVKKEYPDEEAEKKKEEQQEKPDSEAESKTAPSPDKKADLDTISGLFK